jgi:3-phenylpropionate/trans-cinnamate dioxygenase ferredoxin subunit
MPIRERIAHVSEVPNGEARRFRVGTREVAVVNIDDHFYAIGDTCSHAEYSLSDGLVWPEELEIECPQHGAMFSLVTGEPQTLPATQPVPVFLVERDGDDLYVTTDGGNA